MQTSEAAADIHVVRFLVVGSTVAWLVTMPIVRGRILWSASRYVDNANYHVSIRPFHAPVAILVAGLVLGLVRRRGGWGPLRYSVMSVSTLALLGWSLVATSATPSWRGVDWLVHVCVAAAVAFVVLHAEGGERVVILSAAVGVGVVQGMIGIAQSLNGGHIGLNGFEYGGELYQFGDRYAGDGSFGHPYHLTVFLMVAVACALLLWHTSPHTRIIGPALFLLAVSLPFTFSRASLLGLAPMVLIGLFAGSHPTRRATIVLALGLALGAVATFSGWTSKAEISADGDRFDSGRVERIDEALELTADHPVVGVGPGRYSIQVAEQEDRFALPPHNAVAQAGAEMGVPGLLLTGLLIAAFTWQMLRSGALAAMSVLSILPFHLLDSYPHAFPTGILLSGLWVGVTLVAARTRERSSSDASPARRGLDLSLRAQGRASGP